MTSWDLLLDLLASGPRENGTPALGETADALLLMLDGMGLQTELFSYVAHPYRLRLGGVVALLGGLAYAASMLRQRGMLALVVALLTPALLLVEFDAYVPVFGWPGATEQHHVEAIVAPAAFDQHLILAAHYDTKTDVLDHVLRAPFELLGLPVTLLMLAAAIVCARRSRRRDAKPPGRFERAMTVTAALYGVFGFVALTGGAFLAQRSPGALDNGGSCAALVALGERLVENPPERTKVTLLFLSGEEIGVQGSWVYARERFSSPPKLPTAVINLEFLGASDDFATFKGESFATSSYPPDPYLLDVVDGVHRGLRGKPLWTTWYEAATDGRSFLAHGIPTITLINDLPGHALARGMHSPADNRERVEPAALDTALELLDATVRKLDAQGLRPS